MSPHCSCHFYCDIIMDKAHHLLVWSRVHNIIEGSIILWTLVWCSLLWHMVCWLQLFGIIESSYAHIILWTQVWCDRLWTHGVLVTLIGYHQSSTLGVMIWCSLFWQIVNQLMNKWYQSAILRALLFVLESLCFVSSSSLCLTIALTGLCVPVNGVFS